MIIALKILGGFAMLIVGSEIMIRGATRLAALLGMTPLVIGLTVVAFGTSSPELGVSINSVFSERADIAVGNAVGSNTLNILLVLGLSAFLLPIAVKPQVARFDVPIMICATVALWLLSRDGNLTRWEGLGFVTALLIYIATLIRMARRETRLEKSRIQAQQAESSDAETDNDRLTLGNFAYNGVLVVIGLAILGYGSKWFVDGSEELARLMNVSELLIGITVTSIGTSLPELVTTVIASIRGQRDMAVGNIIGSNIFNICCVLGVTAAVAPGGLPVADKAISTDIPVTLVVAALCFPLFYFGGAIRRWEGFLMLVLYGAYLTYRIMSV